MQSYRERLAERAMLSSMSRKRDCWDNAVAESFFATLEFELLEGRAMESRSVARERVVEFIEVFYNRQRSHQTLNYVTPEEYETGADVY